ncbi:UDP-glucose 4-epimerase GalE [uncultured Cohaesibacter sp.]|uniref:UDP-glucose 4-epimerase GalE n=1 Tax=uncultured Cohaesibacter sp. TaxID=1002546 RepID=UPI00292CF606|nr:UDP-glucose 4-epimerase GalE [uncultured Cohaesibacter sp.]
MTKRKILVCGGAGYIGSHMVQLLLEEGHDVVVFDNLSSGHEEAIKGAVLERGDLLRPEDLEAVFARHKIDAVIHFAALIAVGESVERPDLYYRNNVTGTLNLLDAMRKAGVERLVFSSTAAVFGNPQSELIDETHPLGPINPYGWSKRMVEQILADYATAFGLRSVALRYFNAAGAHPDGLIGEAHYPETHLVPLVLFTAMGIREKLSVFGSDYETRDGTCIRDYIHVLDLASAHLLALDYMDSHEGFHSFNLGNGNGFTNLEVIETAKRLTNNDIPYEMTARRAGDSAVLVADSSRAKSELGWKPKFDDLETIIETAWRWHHDPKYGPFAGSKK